MIRLNIEKLNGILLQAEVDCQLHEGLRYGQAVFNRLPNDVAYTELNNRRHHKLWNSNDRHFVKTYAYEQWWNQHD